MPQDAPRFRLRFRIRTLLVLVLVSALGLGFETTRRRVAVYRSRARSQAASELYCRNAAAALEQEAVHINMIYGEHLNAIRQLRLQDDALTPQETKTDRIIDEDVKRAVTEYRQEAVGWRKRAADHAAMRLRYERAVWRPWLSTP